MASTFVPISQGTFTNGVLVGKYRPDDSDDEVKDKKRRVTAGLVLALEEVHARES